MLLQELNKNDLALAFGFSIIAGLCTSIGAVLGLSSLVQSPLAVSAALAGSAGVMM